MLETTNHPTRRRWIQSVTALTLGTAIVGKTLSKRNASSSSEKKTASQPSPPEELILESPLPEPIFDPAANTPLAYEEFISGFALRHIKPHEIINPHLQTTRGVTNSLPPMELWPAMPATLFVADEIRERLGKPLKLVTSAYRNPTYNRACGGASQSWHTKNCALDLVFEGGPREAHAIARDLRDEGFFEGGIGLYKTFIHIDTRGHNSTWHG